MVQELDWFDLVERCGRKKEKGRSKGSPRLVYIGRSGEGEWTKRDKKRFRQILSWEKEARGRSCQLLRMDLTSLPFGHENLKEGTIQDHFTELRRLIEKKIGSKLEFYKVHTGEGPGEGVYHLILSVEKERAVFIPKDWLSATWEKLHGAPIVSVKRMGHSRRDLKNVAMYFVAQYLGGGQRAVFRVSWSWWRARVSIEKGWQSIKKEWLKRSEISTWVGKNPDFKTCSFSDLIASWDEILAEGVTLLGDTLFGVRGRTVVELF